MLRPYARMYIDPVKYCTDIARMLEGKSGTLDGGHSGTIAHEIGIFLDHARYAQLEMAMISAVRLRHSLETKESIPNLRLQFLDLVQRIYDELSVRRFFYVSNQVAPYYEQPLTGWGDVPEKFPSAIFDIEEAGKCLALGRGTACVLHLMRVLEPGLNAMATQFKVGFEYRDWGSILNDLLGKVNAIGDDPRKGADWKDIQHFYSDSVAYFRVFKNAWRNYAMHAHEKYGDGEARTIHSGVRDFMKHLAERLAE